MKLIYTPSGRAGEYANKGYAANLFNGCLHGCLYCYVPAARKIKPEVFRSRMTPYPDVLHRLKMDLLGRKLEEPLFLSFSCDPYPPDDELCAITRKAIEIVMESGNAVNILTKGGMRAAKDFDLLKQDKRNRIGATLTFLYLRTSRKWEPLAAPPRKRIEMLDRAKRAGISTWASMEPVIKPKDTLRLITEAEPFVDVFKVGKWNHAKDAAGIDWKEFYHEAKDLLDNYECRYMIKEDLAIAAGCGAVKCAKVGR
jgi:DNA repair photolyase